MIWEPGSAGTRSPGVVPVRSKERETAGMFMTPIRETKRMPDYLEYNSTISCSFTGTATSSILGNRSIRPEQSSSLRSSQL